jgi:hypothetical protein
MFRERAVLEVRDGSQIVERLFSRLDEYAERIDDEPPKLVEEG